MDDGSQAEELVAHLELVAGNRGAIDGELNLSADHIEADAATDVFLDSIEKLLNNFVEQRAEILLQKARTGQMTQQEKQELQAILNAS